VRILAIVLQAGSDDATVERLVQAFGEATGKRRDLTFDPFSVLLILGILFTYVVLRLTGRRKSTRRRIEEMEDADFPADDLPVPADRRPGDSGA
jgi:hypothetical protein